MRRGEIKIRILDLAHEKFLKHGFYKVSIDSLVDELRTSKSSLYNHYSSKDELVKAVLDKINDEINRKLETVITNPHLEFKEKLVSISEFTKNLLSQVSDEFLKDLEVSSPGLGDYYQEQREDRIQKYYKKLFETGISEGIIRKDIDLDLLLAIYLNLTLMPLRPEYYQLLNIKNENLYAEVQEVFLKGILRE